MSDFFPELSRPPITTVNIPAPIIDYKTVGVDMQGYTNGTIADMKHLDALNRLVRHAMEQGYQPMGPMVATKLQVYQTLVKYGKCWDQQKT